MDRINISKAGNKFINKNILAVLPHPDDEINLLGNILFELNKNNNLKLVYTVLPEREKDKKTRVKELFNSLSVFNIRKEQVIFLGYKDTYNTEGNHYFNIKRDDYINSLTDVINKLKPEIIFGTDFDFHADHRAISIGLREAISKCIKKDKNYKPEVYFGFCYDTAFIGINDYTVRNLKETLLNKEELDNVTLDFDERISLFYEQKPQFIWNKKQFKALLKHHSQYAALQSRSVINRDNVFFKMNTNSLRAISSIMIDNKETCVLNDGLMLDTFDICPENPKEVDAKKGIITVGNKNIIEVNLFKAEELDSIILYGDPNNDNDLDISLLVNEKVVKATLRKNGKRSLVSIGKIKTNYIKIEIISKSEIKLSEIEVLLDYSNSICDEFVLEKDNPFMEIVNNIGYTLIEFLAKAQRKIFKIFKNKM